MLLMDSLYLSKSVNVSMRRMTPNFFRCSLTAWLTTSSACFANLCVSGVTRCSTFSSTSTNLRLHVRRWVKWHCTRTRILALWSHYRLHRAPELFYTASVPQCWVCLQLRDELFRVEDGALTLISEKHELL